MIKGARVKWGKGRGVLALLWSDRAVPERFLCSVAGVWAASGAGVG